MESTSPLKDFTELKQGVLDAYAALAALAGQVGLRSLERDVTATRIPKLADERFHLVVLGEFNHGKSTFVNALLGKEVLPTGITPTTATLNHVVWGERPAARTFLLDGCVEPVAIDRLTDWVVCGGASVERVQYVEVAYPADLLKPNVTLVDTPGVNDLNEQRAEITYSYVPRADAVVLLLDAGQILKQSERIFLEEKILARTKERLLFVVGKIDQLTAEERALALEYARAHLARLVPDPTIFALSPRLELAGEHGRSGFAPFLAYLGAFLAEDRGRVILDNALGDAARIAVYLRQNLGIKRHGLALALAELEERVARVRERLGASRRTIQTNRDRIRAEVAATKALVTQDLDAFVGEFCAALPAAIDAVDAGGVKRHLSAFIADKLKEWAEREGEKVGAALEKLAEEIIQITNEDVREAMEGVARELGVGQAHLAIDVDTLKYDMGVFALGTLGTAFFFFVNTFVGGLLFAATPIVAVLLRGIAEREIKAQAKQRAPEAIRQAADAVRPRLLQAIDEHAARLDEFVVQAGEALHRSLSELLDQVLAERRAAGPGAEEVRAGVDGQIEQLAEIQRQIEALRSRLWAEAEGRPASAAERGAG